MCAMAMVHSRVSRVYFGRESSVSGEGALGSAAGL